MTTKGAASAKSLSTPAKIIKILKLLVENPLSIDEILDRFEDDEIFIERETISKYFATLRKAGCDIQKRKSKFYIKYPVLYLNDIELDTLAGFQKNAKDLSSKTDYEEFLKFLEKLFALSGKEENAVYKRIYQNIQNTDNFPCANISLKYRGKIEMLSKFLNETPQRVKIIYEDKEYSIVPVKFHYFKDSVCLKGYDIKNNVNKNFSLDKISEAKEMPLKAQNTDFGMITTFKISGRLKNAYSIREGEIVTEYNDYIVVSNKDEDKNELFKRLLKYGTCCENKYPKKDREEFISLIKELISKHK